MANKCDIVTLPLDTTGDGGGGRGGGGGVRFRRAVNYISRGWLVDI